MKTKYVVLEYIDTGVTFWTCNKNNNTHDSLGKLAYKELCFVKDAQEAIDKIKELRESKYKSWKQNIKS